MEILDVLVGTEPPLEVFDSGLETSVSPEYDVALGVRAGVAHALGLELTHRFVELKMLRRVLLLKRVQRLGSFPQARFGRTKPLLELSDLRAERLDVAGRHDRLFRLDSEPS